MSKKYTNIDFINKANKIHNFKYNYSLVNYKNSKTKVKIICNIHGEFEQQSGMHLFGRGCPKCGYVSFGALSVDKKTFIDKANKIHNFKYNYSLVNYKNSKTKVKIFCNIHGEFEQLPYNHLIGKGCGRCGGTKQLNINEFLLKSNNIHNFKYDYSLSIFKNVKTKIKIICPIHKIIFEQTPNHHMKGVGCPVCNESIGEKNIRIILENNNIHFNRNKRFNNCKYKRQLPFDFYLPKLNICIEYDGKQHYEPITHFGGEKYFKLTKIKDNIKNEFCISNNIKLIRIRYDENIIDKLNLFLF